MNLNRIKALIIRHLYVYHKSIPRLLDVFFWPVMDLLILGFLSLYLNSLDIKGVDIISLLLGAVILWQIVDRAQNAISVYFLEDVWERNFLNLFVTPLTLGEFFLAGVILGVVRIVIVGVIMSVIAFFLYSFNIFTLGILLVPFLLNLFLFGVVLALFINGIILRFGSSAQVLAFGMALLVQPISAVYYPVSSLPNVIQYVSYALPTTYVFESLREISTSGTFNFDYFWIGLTLNIIYVTLMWFFFKAMFKKVKMLGRLLKVQN